MIYDTEILNALLGARLANYWVSNIRAETSVLWIVNLLPRDYIENETIFRSTVCLSGSEKFSLLNVSDCVAVPTYSSSAFMRSVSIIVLKGRRL
jgi:hypothetical protein